MAKRVVIIGFHPDVPGLPARADVIRNGLDAAKATLDADGFPCDLLMLKKDESDAAAVAEHAHAPRAVIAFNESPDDSVRAAKRAAQSYSPSQPG